MSGLNVGILHPGAMGVAIAASAIDSGCRVFWASDGRRPVTRERAARAGLTDVSSLERLCATCDVILSVCPPEFAGDVAHAVAATGFTGIVADLNALSPQHKVAIATMMGARGIRFADGGIIGLPTRTPGQTTIFLSGAAAPEVAACFANGAIGATVLEGDAGRASALKILFAAWNKGTIALFTSLYAAARHYGVLDELQGQFAKRGVALAHIDTQIVRAAPKAWRWLPEMHEIAAALEAANLPGDFHRAAAVVYERLAGFKDAEDVTIGDVLARASGGGDDGTADGTRSSGERT